MLQVVVALAVALTSSGLSVTPAAVAQEPEPAWVAGTVPLVASDVAYDEQRDLLWVTVLSSDRRHGNELVAVRPSDGAVVRSVYVGSEPSVLALSPDRSTAHIGLRGANQLVRVTLDPLGVDGRTTMPDGTNRTPSFVEDIVVPGDPDVAVVSVREAPPGLRVLVVDEEGVRPDTAGYARPSVLTEGPDARTVYGYDSESTGFRLYTLDIDDDGVRAVDEQEDLVSGFGVRIVYDDGLVFATSGRVVDPEAGTVVGTYAASGAVLPDGEVVHIWSPGRIDSFDRDGFTLLASQPAPDEAARSLVRAGARLAGVTESDRLVIFRPASDPHPDPGPEPEPDPAPAWVAGPVALVASDVVYDQVRDLLWATVLSSDERYGNELVAVRPSDGAVVRSIHVGSEPTSLALSPDASTIHVGLSRANQLVRVSLDPLVVERRTTIMPPPSYNDEPVFVEDVIVPDHPDVALVSLRHIPTSHRHAGFVVVDDGGVRPVRTRAGVGRFFFTAGPDARTVYSKGDVVRLDDDGARIIDDLGALLGGGHGSVYEDGLHFSSTGRVVDPAAGTVVGTYPAAGPVLPDGEVVHIWSPGRLHTFDRDLYLPVRSQPAPDEAGRSLVRAGSRLAGVSASDQLVIFRPASDPQPGPQPDPEPAPEPAWVAGTVPLVASDVAYDQVRDLLWVTVLPTDRRHGNELVAVRPSDGTVVRSVHVGSEPTSLALSPDASKAHVGLSGSNQLVRVSLDPLVVERRTTLPDGAAGPRFVEDVVAPGGTDVALVSLNFVGLTTPNAGAVVVDDAGARPATTEGHAGPHLLAGGSDVRNLYGYDPIRAGLYALDVDDDGLHIVESWDALVRGVRERIVHDDGLVYSSDGRVVDPVRRAVVGTYAASGAVLPDGDVVHVWSPGLLHTFDRDRFTRLGSQPAPNEVARSLVRAGDVLAGVTESDRLVVFRPATDPQPDPQPDPDPEPEELPLWATGAVSLVASDVAYDQRRDLLWVTVASTDATHGDELVAVRPSDGAVVGALHVGSEPSSLALSPDASTAYVGLSGANQLVRVSLDPLVVEQRTTMPLGHRDEPLFAEDVVVPGDADVAVVSLSDRGGTAVVDGTGVRPVREAASGVVLTTGPDERTLHSYDNRSSGFVLHILRIDDDGVRAVHGEGKLVFGYGEHIVYDDGLVFSSGGRVVDPAAGVIVGTYAAGGAILPDGDVVHVWSRGRLHTFDRDRFVPLGSQPAPDETAVSLVRAGEMLAGLTESNRLIIFRPAADPQPDPDPQPGPDPDPDPQPDPDPVPDPDPEPDPGAPTRDFSDLGGGPHVQNIRLIAGAGIAGGYPNGTYRPQAVVTRGQMATFLTRAFDLPAGGAPPPDTVGNTHAAAVASLLRAGISTGFTDGTYRPNSAVTRAQMATFLTRALALPGARRPAPFTDVSGPHAASIDSLYEAGIAAGTGPRTYGPDHDISRGQMATFLARALGMAERLR